MKKGLFRGLILGIIFVVSIIFFSNVLNRDFAEDLKSMDGPMLPVLYMQIADTKINPMYGNIGQMDVQYERESITPLTTKREMELVIEKNGHEINELSYEVYTADGGTVVESGKLSALQPGDEEQAVQFTLKNRILMNQEYVLCFIVDYGTDAPAYYYTRIVQRAGLNTSQYLSFIRDFYEKCVSKETASGLTQYIEPKDTEKNTSLTRISIHASFDQLTWGSLSPTIVRRAVPTIKEINETTCSIVQSYELSAQDSEQNTEYYQVEEYYRMRYAQSRVMLLDFERNAQQVFDANLPVVTSAGLNLGVVDPDFSFSSNQNADIIAFAQLGELWSYNRSSNKASHVFGFRGNSEESVDIRRANGNHDIRIVRVGESGDIDFIVYGYMNAGDHEGSTGMAAYHYSAERNVTEELAFVPTGISFDFLKEDVEKLLYISQDNHLYLMLEGQVIDVDLEEEDYEVLLDAATDENFVVSESQKTIAWNDEKSSDGIMMMDLTTGEQTRIEAESNEQCRVLGFINEDLIYGNARENDLVEDDQTGSTFAMYAVKIQGFDGETVKEIESGENSWFSGGTIEEGLIRLTRVRWENGAYVESGVEEIMNNVSGTEETVELHLSVSERKGTQVALDFSRSTVGSNVLVLAAEYADLTEYVQIQLDISQNDTDFYYVFARGGLYAKAEAANEAIQIADETVGVVLNEEQQYVWERGNRADREQINTEEIPDIVLAGTLDPDAMEEQLGNNYTVLDLTGCTLDSVLYQVGQGRAVTARQPDGTGVAIVGYDAYNTILYNYETGETYFYGINDSTELFDSAGNVFYSYMATLESKIETS